MGKLEVTYVNSILRELGKYFAFEYSEPTYGDDYIEIKLIKYPLNNSEPTVVSIRNNNVVVFSVNCKPNIPNLPVKQSEYTRATRFGTGWTKITCNKDNIMKVLAQLPTLSTYI